MTVVLNNETIACLLYNTHAKASEVYRKDVLTPEFYERLAIQLQSSRHFTNEVEDLCEITSEYIYQPMVEEVKLYDSRTRKGFLKPSATYDEHVALNHLLSQGKDTQLRKMFNVTKHELNRIRIKELEETLPDFVVSILEDMKEQHRIQAVHRLASNQRARYTVYLALSPGTPCYINASSEPKLRRRIAEVFGDVEILQIYDAHTSKMIVDKSIKHSRKYKMHMMDKETGVDIVLKISLDERYAIGDKNHIKQVIFDKQYSDSYVLVNISKYSSRKSLYNCATNARMNISGRRSKSAGRLNW